MDSQEKNKLDKKYQNYVQNIFQASPDGITVIDLPLLRSIDIFSQEKQKSSHNNPLFHVIEEDTKLTLFNEMFIVWIIPKIELGINSTYILIAKNEENETKQLEMMLSASGVYNSSKIILRVIEYCLQEIKENEECLHQLQTGS